MRAFVTGATGFIGAAVCRAMIQTGFEVSGLTSRREGGEELRARGIEPVIGDMRDPDALVPAVERSDVAVICAELAGKGRMSLARVAERQLADRAHTVAVVSAASRSGARVIYTSGYLIFGDRHGEWIDEKCDPKPLTMSRGHADIGAWVLERARLGEVQACVLAPGMVYGPGGTFARMAERLAAGRLSLPGSGDNYWSPVHVDDLAQAYVSASTGVADGRLLLIVDDEPVQMRQLLGELAQQMGVKAPGRVPSFLARLALGGPLVDLILASTKAGNKVARAMLDWQPDYPTYREGVPVVAQKLRERVG